MTDDRHEKKFDGLGKPRKFGARPVGRMPVYQPDDPRIIQDLRRGAGVGVDLSKLSQKQRDEWFKRRDMELLSGGIRTPARDLVTEANRLMQQPLDRFKPEDEDSGQEE